MKPIITLKDIYHDIGHNKSIQIDKLDFYDKENVFIQANPESGLTSFLKIISGVLAPDQGEVRIMNEDLSYCHEKIYKQIKKQVTFAFQHGVMLSNLTIYENLMLTLNFHMNNLKGIEKTRMVYKASLQFGLQDLLQKRPVELSFMQRKFIGILRSFIIEPNMVVIDEPFQNFNQEYKDRVHSLIELHLGSGGNIIYGSTQNDEISITHKEIILTDYIKTNLS